MTGRELRITVDNHRCHRYGICEAEAPRIFRLGRDGRLHHSRTAPAASREQVVMAARSCPMQAIFVEGRKR